MSFRRPFSSIKEDEKEDRSLPLPTLKEDVKNVEKTAPDEPSKDELSVGVKNLELLLKSLGYEVNLAERIVQRMREIDGEITRLDENIAQLERQRKNLLMERQRITEVIKTFAGIKV
ncbi:MAG: hypothetical protein ABWK01_02990 [Infirmifilum sp.]